MNEKTKKTLIIIGFVIIIIGLGYLLWLIFFKPKLPTQPVVPPPVTEEKVSPRLPVTKEAWEKMTYQERSKLGLPVIKWPEEEKVITPAPPVEKVVVPPIDEIAKGGKTWITPITEDKTIGATISLDGKNSIYYDSKTGKFYKIDKFGNKTLFSNKSFYDVQKVNWAPTKDRAILTYPDGFKIMYDFDKEKQYTLPKNWDDFSWGPAGANIAFKSNSDYPENRWLATARADGSGATPVEHMGDNADKVTVSWSPNNQVIAFSATGEPRGEWEQEMLLIGKHQENFKSLVVDGRGFDPKWSPQGDKIIYSVYSAKSNYKPKLYIVDAQGNNIGADKIDLNLNTWADKCTFNKNGQTVYCAVPKDLPMGSGLMPNLADDVHDNFYKIDTTTGDVSFLAEGATGGFNVDKMYLSDDESILYFIDKMTGKLRYIRLK